MNALVKPPIIATDPPVSERQRRAMFAAAEGHSTLGIPKKVGEEFVGKDSKRPHAEVEYGTSTGEDRCGRCAHYLAAGPHCRLVEDPIKADGWCKLFQASDPAQDAETLAAAGVMFIDPTGHILLLRRQGADHAGEWALPGGMVEEGEEPEEAARREAVEELGHLPKWEMPLLDHQVNKEGLGYYTHAQHVGERFTPRLNHEHDAAEWHHIDRPPEPLHPGLRQTLEALGSYDTAEDVAQDEAPESSRSYDAEGRLHVTRTPISKANVCEYLGREIPGWRALGLDGERRYKLLRDPEELKRGAPTFDGIQILLKHKPTTADQPNKELVIGSTHTGTTFEDPYLYADLSVWPRSDIRAVEAGLKKELSSAYRYRADMTPGKFRGEAYDGVMRDIRGNHVAVVKDGRAGSDVVVADSALITLEDLLMPSTTVLSRKGALVQGALAVFLQPKMAQDAKLDLTPHLVGITSKNWGTRKAALEKAVRDAATPLMAQDANLDDMHGFIDRLDKVEPAEGADADPEGAPLTEAELRAKMVKDADPAANVCEFLKGKLPEADLAAVHKMLGHEPPAADETEEERRKREGTAKDNDPHLQPSDAPVTRPAMDAALKAHGENVRKEVIEGQRALREAEKFIQPWVGELAMACDSAEAVYRGALTALRVPAEDFEGLPINGLRAIIKSQPKPSDAPRGRTPRMAQDSAGAKSYNERFGGAHIKVMA